MSYRSYDPNAYVGYGVSTRQVNENDADIQYSIIDILANADLPALVRTFPVPRDIFALVISVQWRVKVIIREFDRSRIKIYDGRNGKSQYGNYVTGSYTYVSSDGFISYEQTISPLFSASLFVRRPNFEFEELPCDEPIRDLGIPPSEGLGLFPYTQSETSTVAVQGYSLAGRPNNLMADSYFGYLSKAVQSYESAVTYITSGTPMSREQFDRFLPRIILL